MFTLYFKNQPNSNSTYFHTTTQKCVNLLVVGEFRRIILYTEFPENVYSIFKMMGGVGK